METKFKLEQAKRILHDIDCIYVYEMTRGDIAHALCKLIDEYPLKHIDKNKTAPQETEKIACDIADRLLEIQYEMLDGKYYKIMKQFFLNSSLDITIIEELTQCLKSYEKKLYYPCVCGLLPLIERTILSDIKTTKYNWENLEKDFKKIHKEKISSDTEINLGEYAIRQFIKKLSKRIEFDATEPTRLNRNWILHGRSEQLPTKVDCLKLFNLIETIVKLKQECIEQ